MLLYDCFFIETDFWRWIIVWNIQWKCSPKLVVFYFILMNDVNPQGCFVGCITSLIFMFWIGIGYNVAKTYGINNMDLKVTSIDGCEGFINETIPVYGEVPWVLNLFYLYTMISWKFGRRQNNGWLSTLHEYRHSLSTYSIAAMKHYTYSEILIKPTTGKHYTYIYIYIYSEILIKPTTGKHYTLRVINKAHYG